MNIKKFVILKKVHEFEKAHAFERNLKEKIKTK